MASIVVDDVVMIYVAMAHMVVTCIVTACRSHLCSGAGIPDLAVQLPAKGLHP